MSAPARNLPGRERLIVALDVPTHAAALRLVEQLPQVAFFKIGLELLMAGDLTRLVQQIRTRRESGIFVDLKLGGDIGTTIERFIAACMAQQVRFVTLVEANPPAITASTLKAARAARGAQAWPRLLMVPLLSSLNAEDLHGQSAEDFVLARGKALLAQGCDGLIVSGEAIAPCRKAFPQIDIVSPGIRPAGSAAGDHKRHATPRQAIGWGADYLVVGRPITQAADPAKVAQAVIDEIDAAT